MLSRKAITFYYSVWMVTLATLYYLAPSWGMPIWGLVGLSGGCAVLVGVHRNACRKKSPWIIAAMALFSFSFGDIANRHFQSGKTLIYFAGILPIIFYAITILLVAAYIALLLRSGMFGRDQMSVQDSFIIVSASILVIWVFLVSPYNHHSGLTVFNLLATVGYPLADVALLTLFARLLVTVGRNISVIFLLTGTLGLLFSDIAYGVLQIAEVWTSGTFVDCGWIAFYWFWGAAVLHPSVVHLTEPHIKKTDDVNERSLVMFGLASLVGPVVLFCQAAVGMVRDGVVIAIMSTIVFALVMVKFFRVVVSHREALDRERGLRVASAALMSVTDGVDVEKVIKKAVSYLFRKGTKHTSLLLSFAPASETPDGSFGGRPGDPSISHGYANRICKSDDIEVRYVNSLPDGVAEKFQDFDIALVSPMTSMEAGSEIRCVGALLVAADEKALIDIRGVVEVLAFQTTLALERIRLSHEIGRRKSEEYFRTLVQNTADVILILEKDHVVRYVSPSFSAIFGSDNPVGVNICNLLSPENRGHANELLEWFNIGDETLAHYLENPIDWTILRSDGVDIQVEASFRDLRDDPTIRGMVVTLHDVTRRRQLERDLTHQAFHDSLTGLANRVLLQERMRQAIINAESSGHIAGLLFIDLDDFQFVNDALGHELGDELLIAVAKKLLAVARQHDTVARLSGDEFAIVIERVNSCSEIEMIADRLVKAFGDQQIIGGNLVSSMASVGVATTLDAHDASELLRQADLAIHVAKRAGKGQWRRYQPDLHSEMIERMEVRKALDKAIADNAFTLFFQPIVSLQTGKTVGMEALIRLIDPVKGVIPPSYFIEVAEESGLIVTIGAWVLKQAISSMAEWHQRYCPGRKFYISVNVSVLQFRDPSFIDQIIHHITRANLSPRSLMLEITETILLRDDGRVKAGLERLRQLGIRIAIDDFGTGYSSLSYLRDLPVDIVKIDRTFVEKIDSSPQQRALVEGIVRLAKTLGLKVVAEGIERVSNRDILREFGCHLGQGYLFSKPMNDDDTIQWLIRSHANLMDSSDTAL